MLRLSLQSKRVITMAIGLLVWSNMAWGATLTWDMNTESDLAGYRVYECDQLPCRLNDSSATLLVTLGKVTSFYIGTPVTTKYYVITAYDFANNESGESNIVTYTPIQDTSIPSPEESLCFGWYCSNSR